MGEVRHRSIDIPLQNFSGNILHFFGLLFLGWWLWFLMRSSEEFTLIRSLIKEKEEQ
jgi:hypothetical protein